MKFKYTIIERSTFIVDLDVDNESAALDKISEMFEDGELYLEKSDEYENESEIEAIAE